MKKYFLLPLLCLSLAAAAQDQDTKRDKLRELIAVTRADSLIKLNLERGIPSVIQLVQQELNDTLTRRELPAYASMELGNLMHDFREKDIMKAYDTHFSEAEVDSLVAFFSSPAGKKWLDSGMEISRSLMQASTKLMMNGLKEKLTIKVKELQKIDSQEKEKKEKEKKEKK